MSSIKLLLFGVFVLGLQGCERQKHTPPVVTAGKAPFECPSQEQVDWNQAKHDPTRFIAHAGGHINGRKYTNSQEAIMNSIESGFQLIELDLIVTQDGKLVAAHDWANWTKRYCQKSIPSFSQFMKHAPVGAPPLDMKQIQFNFKANPNLYLVTDKIRHFELLKDFLFPERLIIEVFSLEDYQKALDIGFSYPMLSLFNVGGNAILKTVVESRIPLIAVESRNIKKYAETLRALRKQKCMRFCFYLQRQSLHKSKLR